MEEGGEIERGKRRGRGRETRTEVGSKEEKERERGGGGVHNYLKVSTWPHNTMFIPSTKESEIIRAMNL